MPDDIRDALQEADLQRAYDDRPAYQRNDYLGWISRAARPQTREKRLAQMLEELAEGGVYMGMSHPASRRG
ncbi:MAG: YdeI/OmpD-associated family protein [Candidatus Nanopelagicales bacterium]